MHEGLTKFLLQLHTFNFLTINELYLDFSEFYQPRSLPNTFIVLHNDMYVQIWNRELTPTLSYSGP